MLRALYERDIRPDLIVGTSAGALNGAFIASRPQTVAAADELANVWRSLELIERTLSRSTSATRVHLGPPR